MIALITLAISLTGCEGVRVYDCPPIQTYTQEFKDRLADRIATLTADDPLFITERDYDVLIRQVRACRR